MRRTVTETRRRCRLSLRGQPAQESNMNTACRLMLVSALALGSMSTAAQDDGFTKKFPIASCQFISFGGNAYFSLVPGRQLYYSNSSCVSAGKCDALDELWVTTTHDVR